MKERKELLTEDLREAPGAMATSSAARPSAPTSSVGGSREGSWQWGQGPDRPQQLVAVQPVDEPEVDSLPFPVPGEGADQLG